MRISDVLQTKGSGVVTVPPETTVASLLATLADKGIGSIVISTDGIDILGIVSERDVVRQLHWSGEAVLAAPVSSIMTATVITCDRHEELESAARIMTDNRIRHIPVVDEDGRLEAIVSIGDIVKHRIDQLQAERDQLVAYIQG